MKNDWRRDQVAASLPKEMEAAFGPLSRRELLFVRVAGWAVILAIGFGVWTLIKQ